MGASQERERQGEMSQAPPLQPPSQRWRIVLVLAVVAIVCIYGLIVLLDPSASPFESIRDSDGDGRPDSTDPYPDDPFNAEIPMTFIATATYGGFAAVCSDSEATVDWADVEVRLASGSASVSWSDLVQPTIVGPVGYTVLDCGARELGTRTAELIVWNQGSEKGFGEGDYLNFKFDPHLTVGESFSVVLLQESSGRVLAEFSYAVS